MTNSVTGMMRYIFAFLLFLSALGYTLFTITDTQAGFDELPTTQTVYDVQTKIPQEVYWTGAQVVGKLYRLTEDNVPIEVNGVTFLTDKDVRDNQKLVNLDSLYKKEVTLNANGEVERVTFVIQ